MKILRVTSGGQSGADTGALLAARKAGFETGGWAPKGWKTETGAAPWLADYGLKEHESERYQDRTWSNVNDADCMIWFGDIRSPGGRCTTGCCLSLAVPWYAVPGWAAPQDVVNQLTKCVTAETGMTVMAAGNRESSSPGIGSRTEQFLFQVLLLIKGADRA